MDCELFSEALTFLADAVLPDGIEDSPEVYVKWLQQIITSACNLAAPIVSGKSKRRRMYWWSEEVSILRRSAIKARRLWTRSRRSANIEDVTNKRKAYTAAKKALRSAIAKAKNASWSELIATIDADPWGLPYKLVMRKLRTSSPALSETLEIAHLDRLLDSLFPKSSISKTLAEILPSVEVDDIEVSLVEVMRLIRKRPYRNAAPGPDNVKATVWKKVPDIILRHLANLYTLCLRTGSFPEPWKKAALVLIPKGSEKAQRSVKARPICLLDEVGKTFERVISNRINRWLEEDESHSVGQPVWLSESQING